MTEAMYSARRYYAESKMLQSRRDQEKHRARGEIVCTLQAGILHPLPEILGTEVGLSYLLAGEVDVGGEFYDLFDARVAERDVSSEPSSWGLVMGDMCGKGAEAVAVLTLRATPSAHRPCTRPASRSSSPDRTKPCCGRDARAMATSSAPSPTQGSRQEGTQSAVL